MKIGAINNMRFGEYSDYEIQRLERKIDDLKFALERSENKNPYYSNMPKTPSPYAPPPPPPMSPYGIYGRPPMRTWGGMFSPRPFGMPPVYPCGKLPCDNFYKSY